MTAILYIGSVEARAGLWISAYYAGWMQRYLPAQEVDFTAMTHVIHFAVVPRTDGTLDSDVNAVTSANSTDVITRAHAAGVKVLISVGGENSAIGFRGATSSANRTRFVTNIVSFVAARGYDGVDLDWEPLDSSDAAPYASLVNELRAALDAITPRRLLTAAVGSQPALLASLQTKFDQINLMTYSYSGAWPGWVTWFNAPVYDGGYRFPTTGRLMPSADGSVSNFLAAGVAADKLGIGICFYGCNWSGGAGTSTGGAALPRQTWKTPPTVTTLTYSAIVSTYYQPQLYRWDTNAQSAYLSLDQPGSTNDLFISYDDQTACRAKLAYAKRKGLGGLIIWELGGGYRADAPNGQRDILLQSIKQAVATQTAHSATGADELATPQDPHKLLESVTQARQRITSGKMEFDVFTYSFDHPLDGTNQVNLKVVFDGTRRRFEQSGRGYRYVFMGPDADKVTDAKRQELGLDKEAAVRAGLLTGFESHYVTVYDGAVLMEYWETDGKPFQTKIDDPAEGSGTYLFDPRVLGLTPSPSVSDTIGSCLTHNYADSIRLMGKESVEGSEAWHVRASYAKPGPNFDYWIDANNLSRMLKQEWNGDTVLSKYDAANPEDPIPIEVKAVKFYGREKARYDVHFLRRSAQYNVPVDQASWTLAGLKMPVGTEVIDYRTNKLLGYWDGRSLSESFLPIPTEVISNAQTRRAGNLLKLAEEDPKSAFALESATWVILNAPDGLEVEKAAGIIQREHLRSPNLVQLCAGLEGLPKSKAIPLLQRILGENPDTNVQAHACFTLATILKKQADETGDNQAANNAAKLFERVVNDYGQVVEPSGKKLADRAQLEVVELRRLGVGRVAPEIEGEDLNGRKMKLSGYRGNVVVLTFWGTWCGPCMAMVPDERKLVERMDGEAFALIGVNSDDDLAKVRVVVDEKKMTWPSFRDGPEGPISKAWNVHSWPTIYVLDRKGIIRYRDVRGQALSNAVGKLIRDEK